MIPDIRIGLYVCLSLIVAALAAGIACYAIQSVRWRRRIAKIREAQPVCVMAGNLRNFNRKG